jgi:hypothetical protein
MKPELYYYIQKILNISSEECKISSRANNEIGPMSIITLSVFSEPLRFGCPVSINRKKRNFTSKERPLREKYKIPSSNDRLNHDM